MKKIRILNIFLLAFLGFSYSCNYVPPVEPPKVIDKEQTLVDKKFVTSFEPTYKVGMKYTFIVTTTSTTQNISKTPEEVTTEIIELNPPKVKVKFTSSLRGEQIKEDLIDNFDPDIPENGIVNEGKESVTVPSGTYDANKVSYFVDLGSARYKTSLWLVKDIGAVKKVDILPDTTIITSELKNFKN
ncbi:MAG: hypothetical protein U0354_08670 [Candidatus Sericytochromatia bacterium]